MKKIQFILILFLSITVSWGQVGINNTDPQVTLDVTGDVKTDGKLFLEKPGNANIIRNSKLLIQTTADDVFKYDIEISKYGPINYTQFIFEGLSEDGLQDYDTKISTSEYIVTIQGYYFLEATTGDTDIMTHSNISNDNIEGYQIYAYPNATTQTWFLRAFVNNGTFRTRISGSFADTLIDMYLNLVIYRNHFITKQQNTISIDMGSSETGIAPLPTGF